jgi:hypothetical protein
MDKEDLNDRYLLVEKLIRLFHFERIVHLVITVVSLIVLLVAIGMMIYHQQADKTALSLTFGSSGLVTYTGGKLLKMWDQALKIIVEGKL